MSMLSVIGGDMITPGRALKGIRIDQQQIYSTLSFSYMQIFGKARRNRPANQAVTTRYANKPKKDLQFCALRCPVCPTLRGTSAWIHMQGFADCL
jgi:hypothetical protein